MRMLPKLLEMLGGALLIFLVIASSGAQTIQELQRRFDREANSVSKAKLMEKLGDAQFEVARHAGQENDNDTVDLTMEKYRDNVRAALEALKKQHPDAEKHSNGYRQLEMQLKLGIREAQDSWLAAPPAYKPPLQIVRQDLLAMDDEMIRLLFPHQPADPKHATPPPEKQP